MKTFSTPRGVRHLPPGLRLWLARLSIWRLKHGSRIAPSLLLLCLSVFSLGVGYAAAVRGYWQATLQLDSTMAPALAAAADIDSRASTTSTTSSWLAAAELGELQAEIVRLRVLFLRLAELAELDDGEFDLDMN
ncbi:MAG: hypothetical protein HKN42_05800, partial [Granulosicoccus sp.]|nr:hypothetical protein [Granulosicoccus sp.]